MVNNYIQGKLNDLHVNGTVALPRFFYDVRPGNDYYDLVDYKHIQPSSVFMGPPSVCVSTKVPHRSFNSLALSKEALYPHPAHVYPSQVNDSSMKGSLGVCIQHEIAISPQTIAHLVFRAEWGCEERGMEFCREFGFQVPVVSGQANDCLIDLFDRVITRRMLPETWKVRAEYNNLNYSISNLPQFVQHPSNIPNITEIITPRSNKWSFKSFFSRFKR